MNIFEATRVEIVGIAKQTVHVPLQSVQFGKWIPMFSTIEQVMVLTS
jgi:hypothetical protein